MKFTQNVKDGLNMALNEAKILGVEFNREKGVIAVTFSPIALDKDGKIPADNRVQFIFKPVKRFIASYRLGHWNDANAEVIKFEPDQIFEKALEFQGVPIYGWEFIDCDKNSYNNWKDRLSFDYRLEKSFEAEHTIELFQEGNEKHIDMRIWFDDLEVFNAKYEMIPFQDFIEKGKRAWDSIYAGKGVANLFGIFPTKL